MKRAVVFLLSIPLAMLAYETAEQTDWSGGDGVEGPVTDWGDTFDTATDINWSGFPGELALSREALDYPIKHLVDGNFNGPWCVYAADVDGDDDMDILGAAQWDDDITWWENLDGSGTSWTEHTVDGNFDSAYCVYAADVDGDDDIDVLGAARLGDEIAWWENLDGSGTSWTKNTVDGNFAGAISVYAADVDGDNDMDVLGAAYYAGDISWWENLDGSGTSWTEHTVDGDFSSARCVYAADVDGDDDIDVLGAAENVSVADDITWWENLDGSGTSWTDHTVDGNFPGALSVYAADVDGDDDMDVLGAAWVAADITWWENTDGSGTYWTRHTVDGNFDGATHVYAADVDGDGDRDVLGANLKEITWWENLDGSGTTWTEHTVDGDFDGANHVYAADVDGDDDMDVLGTAGSTDDIAWWEVTRFADIGRLTASILDTEDLPWWGVITWTADVPDDSYLTVKVRASDDPGDMGDWTTVTSSGDDLSDYIADDLRYFHYRLIMEASSDYDLTPTFEDITIEWTDHSGVDNVEIFANCDDSGVLIGWSITGDTPLGLRVLRSVDGSEPVAIHDNPLPGSATSYLDRKDNGFGPLAGVEYCYWLEVTDADGMTSRFGPTEPVQIEPKRLVLSLDDPYPSPAQDVVTLGYTLPNACSVELCVYDLAGRRVATLVTGAQSAGRHEVSWDCADQVPGVYLLRLSAPSGVMAGRLVVAR